MFVDDGADAVVCLALEGLQIAQDRFNRPGPRA
jgi:hypothetical protein